jgi:hypothetical protein
MTTRENLLLVTGLDVQELVQRHRCTRPVEEVTIMREVES